MKLWSTETSSTKNSSSLIDSFTIGKDQELDLSLAPWDVVGNMAHARMLHKIGVLKEAELQQLLAELKIIYGLIEKGEFKIADGVEDIHSQVELFLTKKLGSIGKKIHTGRSRNDQVLLDLKLFFRDQIFQLIEKIGGVFSVLQEKSESYQNVLMPGYTHSQVGMVSSFGLWFGAFGEALVDDLRLFRTASELVNQNPLGSAAGYGSSFPVDREYTSELLGFSSPNVNVVYAQMGRGKTELVMSYALAGLASTINKLALDICFFTNQNYDFIRLPDELTTGSSIMPHKRNPDVFELIRGKTNQLMALPTEITMLISNLSSGYHRDYQLLKESIFPALETMSQVLEILAYALPKISVNPNILDDPKYDYLYTVEKVNQLVIAGLPFREAYQQISAEVKAGDFKYDGELNHTHLGSLGNLGNERIKKHWDQVMAEIPFESAGVWKALLRDGGES